LPGRLLTGRINCVTPSWYENLGRLVHDRAHHRQPEPAAALSLLREIHGELGSTDEHGTKWDVNAWRDGLSGSAVASLVDAVAHGLPQDRHRVRITREHVFSFAGRPLESFVATMAWGFGVTGYGWYRTRQIFAQNAGSRVPELLATLRSVSDSPESTWAVLTGDQGLHGLGPAFGTKLAYFTGYDRTESGNGPLIADRWTAWAFWALTDQWDLRRSADLYRQYVETACSWAAALSADSGSVVRSDDIERALFAAGPYVRREWRARGQRA
jgi:hypothetical protein